MKRDKKNLSYFVFFFGRHAIRLNVLLKQRTDDCRRRQYVYKRSQKDPYRELMLGLRISALVNFSGLAVTKRGFIS